jgi:hypothetical protein
LGHSVPDHPGREHCGILGQPSITDPVRAPFRRLSDNNPNKRRYPGLRWL